jgi:hypothetical protein
MISGGAKLPRHTNRARFAGAVGDNASVRFDVILRPVAEPSLVFATDPDVEIPPGSPILDPLLAAAAIGKVTFLTQGGGRVAALVPADIAESILREPPDDEDHPDRPAPPASAEVGDLDQFLSAAMSTGSG